MSRPIVLASTSPYRRALLERLMIPFECASPGVDEDRAKAAGHPPDELVRVLSIAKARAVSQAYPDALVIGGDQCASLDGDILGKPGTRDAACAQLARLAGRTHDLWTGLAVVDGRSGDVQVHVDRHRLTMRALDEAAIAAYVDADDPVDCAGAYKIESLGIALFERIDGSDFTAIVGLPLTVVVRLLDARGVRVPSC